MIVPMLIVGALAVMLVVWPQDMADVVDRIIAVLEEVWTQIGEGVEEGLDSKK